MVELCVGIDGGGTKTRCVVVELPEDEKSGEGERRHRVLGSAEAGSANSNSVGVQTAVKNVVLAVKEAILDYDNSRAGDANAPDQIACVCLSTSGVDREGDELPFVEGLQNMIKGGELSERIDGTNTQIIVENDAYAALASGVFVHSQNSDGVSELDWRRDPLSGIVLIVGTGTIAFGVNGKEKGRVSGWGPTFGDTGSGYDIGYRLLCAVARCHDGRDERKTVLIGELLQHLQLEKPEQLIKWVYSKNEWASIAALAPLCLRAARLGDQVAMDVVNFAAQELSHTICTLKRKLFEEDDAPPVVLVGGLMSSENILVEVLESKLRSLHPKSSIIHPLCEAAEGAAVLAQRWACVAKASSSA